MVAIADDAFAGINQVCVDATLRKCRTDDATGEQFAGAELFNAVSPQPLYSFAAGHTHVFSQNLVNYFNPAFSWYESLFGAGDFQKTLSAFPIVLQGSGANALHADRRA